MEKNKNKNKNNGHILIYPSTVSEALLTFRGDQYVCYRYNVCVPYVCATYS